MGSCLKVSSYGGSSLKETSWAISARVLTWKVPVRLMTIGIILTYVRFQGAVGLECQSERFIDVIDVVDDCMYVVINGAFVFGYLTLSLAMLCEIFNDLTLCVEGVYDRPDKFRFVMLWVYVVGEGRIRV